MKSILKKTLISLFCLALIFGFVSSQDASAAKAKTDITKWEKVGWTKGGYKYKLYLSHADTQKMIKNYKNASAVIGAISDFKVKNPLYSPITSALSFSFKYEIPAIKKADKGKGIYIPITVTWAIIPFVHGYYAQ